MKSLFFLALLLSYVAFTSATTEHFTTNNRQIYASWSICNGCNCSYFNIYAFEYTTQNPNDITPPIYLYYNHYCYNSCTNTYESDWLQNTDPLIGLEISRSGRNAELVVSNLTDSSNHDISISLSWVTSDSQNTNNVNCHNVYSYGVESFRVNSKSNYRTAQLVGSITVDNVVYTAPTDSYSYISGYGEKTMITQHN